MSDRKYHIETLAVHAGQSPHGDPTTCSRAVPVYRTTAYNFRDSKHGADLFGLRELGNIYARLMNPTNDVLAKRIAALEGGAAAQTLSSGTAAIYFTITNIARAGDEVVAASNLYGGTFSQFDAILPNVGIKVNFTPVNDFAAVESAITEKTRLVFIEAVGNPALDIADIEGYAEVAHRHGLPLVVDATFTPPPLLRAFDHGADLVIHSLSKWIGGHGAGIGGIVVEKGGFDWSNPKFALYNEPDAGYHGLRFAHDLPEPLNHIAFSIRLLTVGIRNQGPTLAPDAAWIFLQGVESLPLRIARHSENALKVAQWLSSHPKVAWVNASEGRVGEISRPHPAGTRAQVPPERRGRGCGVRSQGRSGRGAQVRGRRERRRLLAARERRRREEPHHPSRLNDTLAALRGGSPQGRDPAGANPPLDRNRARRRHHRRALRRIRRDLKRLHAALGRRAVVDRQPT